MEMVKQIREIWMEMIPKVFEVAKNESNAGLKALYEESMTCTSEGVATYTCICKYINTCSMHAKLANYIKCLANYVICISYVIYRIRISLGQYDVGALASRYTHKCNDKQNCHFRQCKNRL